MQKRFLFVVLAALLAPAASLEAAAPKVELSLVPAAVKVPAQGTADALVILKNSAADPLQQVRLSHFSDAGIEIEIDGPETDNLPGYGMLSWRLRLSRGDAGPFAGAVHLSADYLWQAEGSDAAVRRLATASLTVAEREPIAVDKIKDVAEVQVKTALKSLVQYRPGILYVVVSNRWSRGLRVTGIQSADLGSAGVGAGSKYRASLTVEPHGGDFPVDIPAGDARVFPFSVKAADNIRPGKHLILLEIGLEWQKGGRQVQAKEVVTHEVDVGILGESEVFKVMGIPNFLVLPGFLMLVTFGCLWKGMSPGTDLKVKVKDPEFWLIAVTLSMAMAFVYPLVTEWLGSRRSYLEGYGLADVVWVWSISVFLGAVAYVVQRTLARWWRSRRTPAEGDLPIVTLKKLHRQGLGVYTKRADVDLGGGTTVRAFFLQTDEGQAEVWVGPKILLRWLQGADAALKESVEQQLTPEGDAGELARLLKQGGRRSLEVRWKPQDGFDGPRRVAAAKIKQRLEQNAILEVE